MIDDIYFSLWRKQIDALNIEFDYMFEVIQNYNNNKQWVTRTAGKI